MWARAAFLQAVAVQGRLAAALAVFLRAERLAAVVGVVGLPARAGRWSAEAAPVGWEPFSRAAARPVLAAARAAARPVLAAALAATRAAAGPVVAALRAARAARSRADLFRAKPA
jgi:hypothetical protein